LKKNVITTFALASVLATGCVNLEALRNIANPTQIEEAKPEELPVSTSDSVNTICNAFKNNPSRAKDMYIGKLLTVTGKINTISDKEAETIPEDLNYAYAYFNKNVTEADLNTRYYIRVDIPVDKKTDISFYDYSLEAYNWNKNQKVTVSGKITSIQRVIG